MKIPNPLTVRSADRPRRRWLRLLGREAGHIRDAVAPAEMDATGHNIRSSSFRVRALQTPDSLTSRRALMGGG